jgi:DNA-binding MarR family transcriptional regulator
MDSTNVSDRSRLWLDFDITKRHLDLLFDRVVGPLGLTTIEWFILRVLYQKDGQQASHLARAVGRAATSFTPNLDKLQEKGLVERRADPSDRRAINIYLTRDGKELRERVEQTAKTLDQLLEDQLDDDVIAILRDVLADLQQIQPHGG